MAVWKYTESVVYISWREMNSTNQKEQTKHIIPHLGRNLNILYTSQTQIICGAEVRFLVATYKNVTIWKHCSFSAKYWQCAIAVSISDWIDLWTLLMSWNYKGQERFPLYIIFLIHFDYNFIPLAHLQWLVKQDWNFSLTMMEKYT